MKKEKLDSTPVDLDKAFRLIESLDAENPPKPTDNAINISKSFENSNVVILEHQGARYFLLTEAAVVQIKTDSTKLQNKVSALEAKIKSMDTNLNRVLGDHSTKIGQLQSDKDKLQKLLRQVENAQTSLSTEVDELQESTIKK